MLPLFFLCKTNKEGWNDLTSVSWKLAGGFQIALKFSQLTSFNIKLLSDNLVKAEKEIYSKSVILDIYLKNVARFLNFHSFF